MLMELKNVCLYRIIQMLYITWIKISPSLSLVIPVPRMAPRKSPWEQAWNPKFPVMLENEYKKKHTQTVGQRTKLKNSWTSYCTSKLQLYLDHWLIHPDVRPRSYTAQPKTKAQFQSIKAYNLRGNIYLKGEKLPQGNLPEQQLQHQQAFPRLKLIP